MAAAAGARVGEVAIVAVVVGGGRRGGGRGAGGGVEVAGLPAPSRSQGQSQR